MCGRPLHPLVVAYAFAHTGEVMASKGRRAEVVCNLQPVRHGRDRLGPRLRCARHDAKFAATSIVGIVTRLIIRGGHRGRVEILQIANAIGKRDASNGHQLRTRRGLQKIHTAGGRHILVRCQYPEVPVIDLLVQVTPSVVEAGRRKTQTLRYSLKIRDP